MNCGPWSEMILHGIPWLRITRSRRMRAAPWAVRVVFTGSSKVIFVSLLQITRMQSYVFDLGIGPMISQEIVCHGCGGMSWGWRGAHRLFYRVCFSGTSHILVHIGSHRLFGLAIGSVFLRLPVFFRFLGVRPVVNRGVLPGFCALSSGAPRSFRCICTIHLYFSSTASVRVES